MARSGTRLELHKEGCEDREHDGLNRFAVTFSVVVLDTMEKLLDQGGIDGVE